MIQNRLKTNVCKSINVFIFIIFTFMIIRAFYLEEGPVIEYKNASNKLDQTNGQREKRRLPDILLVGVKKCGTETLGKVLINNISEL